MNQKAVRFFRGLARILLILLCAFALNTLVLLASGKSPATIYSALFKGAFGGVYNLARSLRWATPLVFTGLAFAVSSRCGIFNIGAAGQLYLGAFAATAVGLALPGAPRLVVLPLAMLAGMAAGMLWSVLAGSISIRFGASIVVVTLMLNYVATLFTEYLVRYPYYEPGTLGESGSTAYIPEGSRLTVLIGGTNVTTGLLIALIAVAVLAFFDAKSVLGYECRVIGANERFAEFSGLRVGGRQMLVYAVSGAIAGLGGAVEILGNYGRFMIDFSPDVGFDGIVVSLLAGGNPALVPLSAFFMGAMTSGSIAIEMFGGVPKAMAKILMGIVIVIITVQKLPQLRARFRAAASGQ